MNLRLKAKIIERYGTQADFAIAVGEHEPTISKVIRGRWSLDSARQERWANALGCDLSIFDHDSKRPGAVPFPIPFPKRGRSS